MDHAPKKHSTAELKALLTLEQYPRSAKYDPNWTIENLMGPNVLWLAESMTQVLDLQQSMRVLDMGCGKALSSIFLAKEFGVQVWATDLWIKASDNWQRIRSSGLEDRVFPIHAEAHDLPFAQDFFDLLVSFDAYHYFGTDDMYMDYYSSFVKTGGQIGMVVPGIAREFTDREPAHLGSKWHPEYWSLHSPEWWLRHWERSGKVTVGIADIVPDGWKHWLKWLEVCRDQGAPTDLEEAEMLRRDAGRNLGFTRVLAKKK